jgi:hypothetical protein
MATPTPIQLRDAFLTFSKGVVMANYYASLPDPAVISQAEKDALLNAFKVMLDGAGVIHT